MADLFAWFVEGLYQAFRFFVVLTVISIVGAALTYVWQRWIDSSDERRWEREMENNER